MAWADIPIIGPIFGETTEQKATKDKIGRMEHASNDYAAYRDINARQRLNAMGNIAGMFQPANNALGQMYGQGAQVDLSLMNRDPRVAQNISHPADGLPQPAEQQGPRHPVMLNGHPPPVPEPEFIKDPNDHGQFGYVPSGPTSGYAFGETAPRGYIRNPKYVPGKGTHGPHNHGTGFEGFARWAADPGDLFPF